MADGSIDALDDLVGLVLKEDGAWALDNDDQCARIAIIRGTAWPDDFFRAAAIGVAGADNIGPAGDQIGSNKTASRRHRIERSANEFGKRNGPLFSSCALALRHGVFSHDRPRNERRSVIDICPTVMGGQVNAVATSCRNEIIE